MIPQSKTFVIFSEISYNHAGGVARENHTRSEMLTKIVIFTLQPVGQKRDPSSIFLLCSHENRLWTQKVQVARMVLQLRG